MFIDFFYRLRGASIPCGSGELLDLIKALNGYGERELTLTVDRFYYVSRCCLVRDERHFDAFDRVFGDTFGGLVSDPEMLQKLVDDWLKNAREKKEGEGPVYDIEQLFKELEDRLKNQTERHDGGNKWIGTGGTSPFGNGGTNPQGVRIGGSYSGRTGIDTFSERRYRQYSDEEKLNVRGFKIALRGLRDLRRDGRPDFDLDASIHKTCANAGEIEPVLRPSRENRMRLVLLTDVGGSMSPHERMVSRLFSAASKIRHFKEFKHYYFHNAVYESVFEDSNFRKAVPLEDLYRHFDGETRFIFAGDACMNPYELFDKRHAFFEFYYRSRNKAKAQEMETSDVSSAMDRLFEITKRYPHSIWLNPEPRSYWWHETISAIGDAIPMFPLTLGGIRQGVRSLIRLNK